MAIQVSLLTFNSQHLREILVGRTVNRDVGCVAVFYYLVLLPSLWFSSIASFYCPVNGSVILPRSIPLDHFCSKI